MKKIVSLIMTVAVIFSLLAIQAPHTAVAADNMLTITSRGQELGKVKVGTEFIFRVNMSSAGYRIDGGEAWVNYDSDYVQVVEHGERKSSGAINMNAYSFPTRIRNANLYANFLETPNQINYNFSKISGITAFNINEHYFKVRFKALAPGTVEIRHYAKAFYSWDGNAYFKLFYNDKGNDQLDQIPYMVSSVEPAAALIGDADGDNKVTVMDATLIQYLSAGADKPYNAVNADVNGDNSVDLRDALAIRRYRASLDTGTNIGEWIFASEQ